MSFGELLLIAVVALVVLGPERLPAVARTVGALVARAQRFVSSVKSDIQQQTDMAGLSSLKQEVQETAYALKAQLTAELDNVQSSVKAAREELAAIPAEALSVPRPDLPAEVATPEQPGAVLPESVSVPAAAEPLPPSPEWVAEADTTLAPQPLPVVNENQLDLFGDPVPSPHSHDSSR